MADQRVVLQEGSSLEVSREVDGKYYPIATHPALIPTLRAPSFAQYILEL